MLIFSKVCINRNIVECKDSSQIHSHYYKLGINRNIVECKEIKIKLGKQNQTVLIETLWNVKPEGVGVGLIPLPRINRNIVECKAGSRKHKTKNPECGINRNIVECKDL